jgi:hypothetical protein
MINEVQRIITYFCNVVLVSAFGLSLSIASAGLAGAKAPLTTCYACFQAELAARTAPVAPTRVAALRS